MREIQLTKDQVALVDDDLFDYINSFKWFAQKAPHTYYAMNDSRRKGIRKIQYMHHLVVGRPSKNLVVDHLDGNGLNNQKTNLRIVTQRQNTQNRICHRKGRLVGVFLKSDVPRTKPWQAKIHINGKTYNLGHFRTELEAHRAYLLAIP